MALRRSVPLRHIPVGASDSMDATTTFPGAMSRLENLIPDPSTRNLWLCRPASTLTTSFAGFTTPAQVSCMIAVGTRVYGMIGSALNAGKDEPFSYNIAGAAFDTITGVTNANSPTTQVTSGAWTPPTMAVVGTRIIVTHLGFAGTVGVFFGVIDISNPAAPTWVAANTATNLLTAVPTAVAQFSGRAYFAVNPSTGQPGVYASDILDALTITNATQILTFGDNVKLTALGSLGLNTQLTGGITQSLIVFKGGASMFQITGDFADNTIAKNAIPIATGTLAPKTVCGTPKGLAFVSPDGLRIMGFDGNVSDPVGMGGTGITIPLIYASVPSRMVAACNADVIRISTQNSYATGAPNQEWWYHISKGVWTGPHSFPASQITPYDSTFIIAPIGVSAKLFQSDVQQSSTSTYTENSTDLSWHYEPAFLPDTTQMAEAAMLETTINLGYPQLTAAFDITAQDENEEVLDSVSITSSGAAPLWGSAVWGSFVWGGLANPMQPRQIPWSIPIVFRRLKIAITGDSAAQTRLGDLFLRYQILKYLQQG